MFINHLDLQSKECRDRIAGTKIQEEMYGAGRDQWPAREET